jgi:XFP-like protein
MDGASANCRCCCAEVRESSDKGRGAGDIRAEERFSASRSAASWPRIPRKCWLQHGKAKRKMNSTPAPSRTEPSSVSLERYLRAVHYLAGAQIYLRDNVLLREPLRAEHVKDRLLGHWGTCPGNQSRLCAPQSRDPARRSRRDAHHRARARRAGESREPF